MSYTVKLKRFGEELQTLNPSEDEAKKWGESIAANRLMWHLYMTESEIEYLSLWDFSHSVLTLVQECKI